MQLKVTDVSFSFAKTATSGSCGFCRVVVNDCIAINRVRVIKVKDEYRVSLPVSESSNNSSKPIVQLLDAETIKLVSESVINQYLKVVKENNGFYKRDRGVS